MQSKNLNNSLLKIQKFNKKLLNKKEEFEKELNEILDIGEQCKFIALKISLTRTPAYKQLYVQYRIPAMTALWTAGNTLEEIGQLNNLTRERVRQLLNKNLGGDIKNKGGQRVRMAEKEKKNHSDINTFVETALKRIKEENLDLNELLKKDGFDNITKATIKREFKKKHPLIAAATFKKAFIKTLDVNFQEFLNIQEDIIKSGHSPPKLVNTFKLKKAQTILLRKLDFTLSFGQWWNLVKPFLNTDFSLNRKDEKLGYVPGNVFVSNARNIMFGLDSHTKQNMRDVIFQKTEKTMILKAKQKISDYDSHKEKIVTMLLEGYSVNSISETLKIPPTSLRDLMKKTSFAEVTKEFSGLSMNPEQRKEEFIKVSKNLGLLKR